MQCRIHCCQNATPYAMLYHNADSEVIYNGVVQKGLVGWKVTLQLVGKGHRSGSGAARCVNDGPQGAVCLRNKADRAARQDPSQRDGPAVVGSAVLDRAREGRDLAIDNSEAAQSRVSPVV